MVIVGLHFSRPKRLRTVTLGKDDDSNTERTAKGGQSYWDTLVCHVVLNCYGFNKSYFRSLCNLPLAVPSSAGRYLFAENSF